MMILLFIFAWGCISKDSIEPNFINLPDSGITLEYAVHGYKSSHCPPIISLHGYPSSWYSSILLMQALPDMHIYAPSLPCYGNSSQDPAIARSYDLMAQVIVEFMDALEIESAFILGHSMSSMLAPRIGLLYPERVIGIITIGTIGSLSLNNDVIDRLTTFLEGARNLSLTDEESIPEDYLLPLINSNPIPIHPIPDWYFNDIIEQTKQIPLKCWEAGFELLRDFNQIEDLKTLELPYLILYSDLDFIPWEAEKGGAEAVFLSVPEVTLVKIHNVGHDPQIEVPDETAEIIRTFINNNH
jgi:pimeloyl-ACP methyl ester carboxylesterase